MKNAAGAVGSGGVQNLPQPDAMPLGHPAELAESLMLG